MADIRKTIQIELKILYFPVLDFENDLNRFFRTVNDQIGYFVDTVQMLSFIEWLAKQYLTAPINVPYASILIIAA